MNPLRLVRARVFGLLRKEELEAGIEDELRFHLSMRTQENIARGMLPADARREASRRLGNVASIKDACRDVSGGGGLEVLWQDVRFAARMLLRDRGFTAIAVLALALGIGANTALFTVMSNVLLRPLPFPRSGEIMSVLHRESGSNRNDRMPLSYPDFLDLASQNTSFAGLGGFQSARFSVQVAGGEVSDLRGASVTSGVFPLLHAEPLVGRLFSAADDEAGNRSVIISHELWRQRFASLANFDEAKLLIDGQEYSVIGVMPPDFRFPIANTAAELWVTFGRIREPFPDGKPAPSTRRDAHFVYGIGRLKEGVTAAAAEKDLSAIAAASAARYPGTNARLESCSVVPLLSAVTKAVRPALLLLVGAALCVLCVACVNVANLLLARSSTRLKEIAIRSALGAGRLRILRQLLTESLLLATLGGSVGLALAVGGTRYIVSVLPPNFPRLVEITPDTRVLAFTCLVTLVTSCLFGFAPAWRSAHLDITSLLNDSSRGPSVTRQGRRARSLLVVTEMVLSFILLAGACCLIRSLWQLENAPPGFNPRHLTAVNVALPMPPEVEDDRARAAAFYQDFLTRLSRREEVKAVSAVYPLPLTLPTTAADFEVMGRSALKADWPRARAHMVGQNYFQTMEIPVRKGRDFDQRDQRGAPLVVIINETLAREVFGGEDPLGKGIRPGLSETGETPVREIIGVVADVKSVSLATKPKAELYLPHAQCASPEMSLVVRTKLPITDLLLILRSVTNELDAQPSFSGATTMEDQLAADIAQPRLNSSLLGAFAVVAVLLTAIGVYGVTSYSVAQRRHEIGIRLALGAQKLAVFRLVMAEGVRLVLWSVLGGGLIALWATPALRGVSYGSDGNEMAIILFVMLLLTGVGLLACCLPAHRAAGEDPLAAIGLR